MKRILIFDIDNTIVNSRFPNLNEKADIKELKRRILNTPLNKDFIEYYRRISNTARIKTYFFTGRKKRDFGEETFKQLEELNLQPEQIKFFSDEFSHTPRHYERFKVYNTLAIALTHKDYEIVVYDDYADYFPVLLAKGLIFEIEKMKFYHVKNLSVFWKTKCKQLYPIEVNAK